MDYIETSHLKKKIMCNMIGLQYCHIVLYFAFYSVGGILWPGDWYGDWTGAFYCGVLLHGP